MYVVFVVGVITTEPLVAFPVEKPVPVHDVAFVDDQVSVVVRVRTTCIGFATRSAEITGDSVVSFAAEQPVSAG